MTRFSNYPFLPVDEFRKPRTYETLIDSFQPVAHATKKLGPTMESQDPMPCSQGPATGPCLEPVQYIPYHNSDVRHPRFVGTIVRSLVY